MTPDKKFLGALGSSALGSFGLFGHGKSIPDYKIIVNYNGQADLLLSLQIPPDYYPYQFKKTKLYDYLTDASRYVIANQHTTADKKKLKDGIQKKINSLLSSVKEYGSSLWNEDLYETGIVYRNDQFWNNKKTSLLFIEQFIADDYVNINDAYNILPSHKSLIVTNYRAARDPYTIFPKAIFNCFKNPNESSCNSNNQYQKLKEYMQNYNFADINSLYRFGKYIDFWNYLDFKEEEIKEWIKDKKLFSLDETQDKQISEKYKHIIFGEDEINTLKAWNNNQDWKMNYESNENSPKLAHHPALEQQIVPGTAPLAEGSQKDITLYLLQFAALIDRYVKNNKSDFEKDFKNDQRKTYMEKARENANNISKQLQTRIKNIRDYFKKIKVVDESFDPDNNCFKQDSSKTFAVVTFPPNLYGAGDATIQSMSKFPFIYRDIGLKQPIPNNLSTFHKDHLEHEIFSVDDNGWWWKIGNSNINSKNLLAFQKTANTILLVANEEDWNLLKDKNSPVLKSTSLISSQDNFQIDVSKINTDGYSVSYNKYHLWNEGLRSPMSLNMLLDNLVDIFQKQYDSSFTAKDEYQKAMSWGDYWEKTFVI